MNLNYLSKHIAALSKYKTDIKRGFIERPQILPLTSRDAVGLRVFVLSDLHTDYAENMRWVKSISTVRHKKDVILIAGDVAEIYRNFVLTMSLLKDRFEHVFYVPGNHDLWCHREGEDYVRNIIYFLEICILQILLDMLCSIIPYWDVLGLYLSLCLYIYECTHAGWFLRLSLVS